MQQAAWFPNAPTTLYRLEPLDYRTIRTCVAFRDILAPPIVTPDGSQIQFGTFVQSFASSRVTRGLPPVEQQITIAHNQLLCYGVPRWWRPVSGPHLVSVGTDVQIPSADPTTLDNI